MNLLIKNGLLLTLNSKREVLRHDLLIEKNRITRIAPHINPPEGLSHILDATDQIVLPGFVQAHTHLVQTLFRGEADDLSLLDWLKKVIWPLEHSHDEASIQASAQLGILEMVRFGVTSLFDMGTVRHTDALLEAVEKSRIRYFGGKCLMDAKGRSGPLYESTSDAMRETDALIRRWHKKRSTLNYVLCPRFVISCTPELLETVADIQHQQGLLVHIHASENKNEVALVKKLYRKNNVEYLHTLGLLNPKTLVIHGVHMTAKEVALMARTKCSLVHCPSSNLKLASGIAPIEAYRRKKINIALGSDGTACNNIMDPFKEMHLAALLQKPLFGPKAIPAKTALEMATLGGARALGMERELGSLEVGKLADIVTVDRNHVTSVTVDDPYSVLVYSACGRDVRNVIVDGDLLVRDGTPKYLEVESVVRNARAQKRRLLARAGLAR